MLVTVNGVRIGSDYKGANAAQIAKAETCVESHRMVGHGPKCAPILVVFDCPSSNEDGTGNSFSGKHAANVIRELARVEIPVDDYRMTYAVRCYTPDVKDTAIKACSAFLANEIERVDPVIIVPFGAKALKAIVGPGHTIDSCAGMPFKVECAGKERTIFPMHSPGRIYIDESLVDAWKQGFVDLAAVHSGEATPEAGLGEYKHIKTAKRAVAMLDAIVDGEVSIDLETNTLSPHDTKIKRPLIFHRKSERSYKVEWKAEQAFKLLAKTKPTTTKRGDTRPPKINPKHVRILTPIDQWESNPTEKAKICIVSWSTEEGKAFYVLRDHIDGDWSDRDRQRFDSALIRLLKRKSVRKKFWNGVFEYTWFKVFYGTEVVNFRDPMMLHHKVDEEALHGLDEVAMSTTGMGNWKTPVEAINKQFKHNYGYIPLKVIGPYAGADSDAALRASHRMEEMELDDKRYRIYDFFDTQLVRTLAHIESLGVAGDYSAAVLYNKYTKTLEESAYQSIVAMPEVRRYQRRMTRKDPKWVFSLGSPSQLQDLLFDEKYFGHEPITLSAKTGLPKTDKQTLKWYKEQDSCEFSKALLEWRKFSKQRSTYALNILNQIDRFEGFIRGHFKPAGTVTGRLASNGPNLQNQPYDARRPYVSRFGELGCLVQADYSQIEVRIAACVSRDKLLLKVYRLGEDVHTATMCRIFGLSAEQAHALKVKDALEFKKRRTIAKRIVFGIIYGIGAPGVVRSLQSDGVTIDEELAQDYIDRFFKAYKGLRRWIDDTRRYLHRHGHVVSVFGRRRHLPDVYSSENEFVARAERQGPNAIIQGSASDMTMTSMILINKRLRKSGMRARVVLTVHDSIIIDCLRTEVEAVYKIVKEIMENVPKYASGIWGKDFDWSWIRCPILADIEVGVNWRDMVGFDPTGKDDEAQHTVEAAIAKSIETQMKRDDEMRLKYKEARRALKKAA